MPLSKKRDSRPIRKKRSVASIKAEKKWGTPFLQLIPKGYELISLLGQGKTGYAYMICKGVRTPCRVFKVQAVTRKWLIESEVKMQKTFHSFNLAPGIHNLKYYKVGRKEYAVIEMDKIDGILSEYIAIKHSKAELEDLIDQCLGLVRKMCKYKLTHGDMHDDNIGYTVSPEGKIKLILIDFGFATQGKCTPALEVIQLLRSVGMKKKGLVKIKSNVSYLEDTLLDIYRDNYNPKLKDSINAWDVEWDKVYNKYAQSSL